MSDTNQSSVPVPNVTDSAASSTPPPDSMSTGQEPSIPVAAVVVPSSQRAVPGWFLVMFIVISVLFLVVTGLLVWTLSTQKKSGEQKETSPVGAGKSPTSTQFNPTTPVSPTLIPTPVDSVVNQLRTLNTSNEISELSNEMEKTDVSFLQEDRNRLDRFFGVSP